MKKALIAVIVVLLLVAFGWLTFGTSGDDPTITIEAEKASDDIEKTAKEVAGEAAEEGAEALEKIEKFADE